MTEDTRENRRLMRNKIIAVAGRDSAIARIRNIADMAVKVVTNPETLDKFLIAADDLDSLWDSFLKTNQFVLEALIDLQLESEFSVKLELEVRDLYVTAMTVINQHRAPTHGLNEENEQCVRDETASVHSRVTTYGSRLPEIPLPSFSGDLHEWPVFRDRFEALVGSRNDLSDIERFYYLLGTLKNTARHAIQNIPVTDTNYSLAWSTLVDRFDKPRQLAMTIVEKLLSSSTQNQESLLGLKEFLITFSDHIHLLRSLNVPDLGEFLLFVLSSRCLPVSTRRQFELKYDGDYPTVDHLIEFVKSRVSAFEAAEVSGHLRRPPHSIEKSRNLELSQSKFNRRPKAVLLTTKEGAKSNKSTPVKCSFCPGSHHNESCPTFKSLSASERSKLAREKRVCFRCLSSSHWASRCLSRKSCQSCNRHHHTLLHSDAETSNVEELPGTHTALVSHSRQPAVLLGTAIVHVRDAAGFMQPVRALVDSASQISVMSSSCVERLGLRKLKWTVPLTGLAGVHVPTVQGAVDIQVFPRYTEDEGISIRAWILPRVTGTMPPQCLPLNLKEKFNNLALADPAFDCPAPVDLLLGADVFSRVLNGKRVHLSDTLPAAFGSTFGWIIIGSVPNTVGHTWESNVVSLTVSLEDVVARFWQLEEPEPAPSTFSDEGHCESVFMTEYSRLPTGRFVVPLPFRRNTLDVHLSGSRQVALRRFENLERKFKSDLTLKRAYTDFMAEYISLGHMTVATEPGVYYIPHHAVFKSDPNSKIRVVFDASAQSSSGHSLNSQLHTGSKLQQDLVDVLLRFRIHRHVFTADICKMYRQILVDPKYRKYQHIFWRESQFDELLEYQLNTVTYGLSCAPYLALRVLKEIADSECTSFPAVQEALRLQTYVDDICVGADSIEQILKLQSDLITVLGGAGLQLKKWISNTEAILLAVSPEDRAVDLIQFDSNNHELTKVLGIQWESVLDVFTYDVQSPAQLSTKRGVLSVIARIFDPLGLLAPAIFYAKHLMQLIWKANISWDSPLPVDLDEKWRQFVSDLPNLSKVKISRHFCTSTNSNVSLCGFCDASERGYAAVVYLRFVASDGSISVSLLGSKTKMAPMKSSTMPRLELCAVVLLSRWMSRIKSTLESTLSINEIVAWSDSQVALSWLSTPHNQFKVFVSNHVYQVHQLLPHCSWNYIRSAENPADCASRGMMPSELLHHQLYWTGPAVLYQSSTQWLTSTPTPTVSVEHLPELKLSSLAVTVEPVHNEWFCRFSSYTRMVRVTAIMSRFIGRCRGQRYPHAFITSSELQDALLKIVKVSQSCFFSDLFSALATGTKISRHYASLQPMVDHRGILCVGGRLQNSDLPIEQKHPILLSKQSHLSLLLARHWHLTTCHAGPRLVISMIMRKFWILSARVIVRKVRSQCTICVRLAAQNPQPIMANLPSIRVQSCRPFSRIGIDYAGPLSMRECSLRKARHYKVYIAIFVCMTVKAVHLETVTDLSTTAFLAALDRFVARRGLPQDIYSDCGTNFVGAAKTLRTLVNSPHNQHAIASHVSCSWHFNPPSAPHFGGLWEAAVRSTKTLLVRTMGCHLPTLEELSTVLCRIEAVLNSRPLTPISASPQDLDYLSPGHFIVGQPLLAIPEAPVPEEARLVPRWKLLHQWYQSFWHRWSSEYLCNLQTRNKWSTSQPNINVGDMVVIKDKQAPPLTWRLGRVTKVVPGQDGVVRVAQILTRQGEILRPVVKLVVLPML